MFIANVSLQAAGGGYPTVTCFVQAGTQDLLPSITSPQPSLAENLTMTGAVTLGSTDIPATASVFCSYQNGGQTITVTQASLSIIQVGTLQTGI
jgi:hypothetical protein